MFPQMLINEREFWHKRVQTEVNAEPDGAETIWGTCVSAAQIISHMWKNIIRGTFFIISYTAVNIVNVRKAGSYDPSGILGELKFKSTLVLFFFYALIQLMWEVWRRAPSYNTAWTNKTHACFYWPLPFEKMENKFCLGTKRFYSVLCPYFPLEESQTNQRLCIDNVLTSGRMRPSLVVCGLHWGRRPWDGQ